MTGDIPTSLINLVNLQNAYGLELNYNLLNVPPDYPDPNNPFHVFLQQKASDWNLYQLKPFVDCVSVVEVPPTECEALLAFYNSTNGPGWLDNTKWWVTDTPSNWTGVQIGSGHVTGLSLPSNWLTGSLPAELGNLTSLEDLNLSYNQLTGSLSPWLGNLVNLNGLVLSNNQLSGNLPSELGILPISDQ